ncbi:MAG: ABC transporter permease, partial [Solirubrobacteraceae bacterium]
AIIAITHPSFFNGAAIDSTLQLAVPYTLLAIASAFLIMMGQLDLSIGASASLVVVICALLISHGMAPWIAALLGIGVGVGLGLVNAFLVEIIGIGALLATLATQYAYGGLANGLANGAPVVFNNTNDSYFKFFGGSWLGVPNIAWLTLVVIVAFTVVLRYTRFGYRVRSIGSNPEAAQFSGISISRVKTQAFVLAGLLAAIAAIFELGVEQTGDPSLGSDWVLIAIASAIIGGTPMRGGSGTIIGAALGAILISAVESSLLYFSVPDQWNGFALGVVIVVAMTIDAIVRRRTRGRALLQ